VLNITIMIGYLAWPSKRVSQLISTHPSTTISIINQIQASVTSEAVDSLGRYDEMKCHKNKIEYIQDKIQVPPQTKS
jgi:hypothetical protein